MFQKTVQIVLAAGLGIVATLMVVGGNKPEEVIDEPQRHSFMGDYSVQIEDGWAHFQLLADGSVVPMDVSEMKMLARSMRFGRGIPAKTSITYQGISYHGSVSPEEDVAWELSLAALPADEEEPNNPVYPIIAKKRFEDGSDLSQSHLIVQPHE